MRRNAAAYLGLLILSLVTFWPVCRHDFINYDDPLYVAKNAQVQAGLTGKSIRWAFTNIESSNWHPLTWLSHMLDCQLFGVNPNAHHAVNLGFHIANSLLLLLVLQQLTGALWRSAWVAALFALHPLHVESVAWIAERKDVLSTFFALLAIWSYGRYVRQKLTSMYLLSLLCFALGLMAKPMLVTVPVLLLLIDFWPLKRFSIVAKDRTGASPRPTSSVRKLLIEKIPFFALAVGSSIITFWAQQRGGSTESLDILPVGARVANAALSYVLYLAKMFWPTDLAVFYPYHAVPVGQALGCGLLLALVSWFAVAKARVFPYVVFGWFWFLITLLPVIGLIQVGAQALADRYAYIPLIGLFVILAWGTVEITNRLKLPRFGPAVAGIAAISACVLMTRWQLAYWENSVTLFTHAIRVTSQNAVAENNLGSALFDEGHFEEAEPHFKAALAIRANYPNAHFNLGLLLQSKGNLDEAEANFRAAIQQLPSYGRAHRFLGFILISTGKYEEAENNLRTAVGFEPGDIEARRDLGTALALEGKNDEALAELEEVLRRNPKDPAAHHNLGNVFAAKGDSKKALSEYSTTLELSPTNAPVREALAHLLINENRTNDAVTLLAEGLNIQPVVSTYSMLASVYIEQGKTADAVQIYRDGLQLKPDSLTILNNLAWILATSHDDKIRNGAEAVKLGEKACSLSQYKLPMVVGTLAAAYAEAGRFPDAVATAQKACDAASAEGKTVVLKKNQGLLELYRTGHSYREP